MKTRKQLRVKQLQVTMDKAEIKVYGATDDANSIDFNQLTSYEVYQLEVILRNLIK